MSRAVVISGPAGKPGQVYYSLKHKDLPRPTIGPNDLLVRMTAAALNHRDLFIRQHLYPGTSFDIPLLADGCGVVVETGKEATNWKGKRVILNPGTGWKDSLEGPEDSNGYAILGGTKYNPLGTLQEYLSVDASQVEEAPKHLSDVEAAALPVTALTAWRVVFVKAGLGQSASPGKKVLITGIGGGVALMALMFAVGAGAEVWVTSSSQEKIDKAKELGATGGINYRKDGWEKDLLAASKGEKKQFDAIIDGAGGDAIEKAVKLLKVSCFLSSRAQKYPRRTCIAFIMFSNTTNILL